MGEIRSGIWRKFRFKNMTISQAFMFLTVLTLLAATIALMLELAVFEHIRNNIMAPYLEEYEIAPGYNTQVLKTELVGMDAVWIDWMSNVQMVTVIITIGGLIGGEALIFYRLKLKKPLRILDEASQKIAKNDLDFQVIYNSEDEMGKLCRSFEIMRASLEENNRQMWRTMDERKRLNAAFAHDLRTPLTVLRGYTDFLVKYLPQNKISRDKQMLTVQTMSEHIDRLENYVTSMNTLQKLEDVMVYPQKVTMEVFIVQLQESAQILGRAKGLKVSFLNNAKEAYTDIDPEIVMQVYENLVSNGVRFAENKLTIGFEAKQNFFTIRVMDDGSGFEKHELKKVSDPFYIGKTEKLAKAENHFGLGLHICKILCEKHGGLLIIKNDISGGGSVTAKFSGNINHSVCL
ncbi:HAMP domain-containing sensor histidine kinase [Acetobacterium tundrae]|nr:HAMP domain-containing sensor histidine kinase [Acetobacterium tundrae]